MLLMPACRHRELEAEHYGGLAITPPDEQRRDSAVPARNVQTASKAPADPIGARVEVRHDRRDRASRLVCQARNELLKARAIAGDYDQIAATPGETFGIHGPDASGGAGDQGSVLRMAHWSSPACFRDRVLNSARDLIRPIFMTYIMYLLMTYIMYSVK
jgi:hypothetical protein